jgi:hypothetical protein
MEQIKCKCGKAITGYNPKHAKYLLKRHQEGKYCKLNFKSKKAKGEGGGKQTMKSYLSFFIGWFAGLIIGAFKALGITTCIIPIFI